ncbi:MAG: GNAT family N-acetyltransferase [Dehalococcoidia bacterium]|nr:GNAT family N-acetyltransferase [Dehalococcoidia bacterium]
MNRSGRSAKARVSLRPLAEGDLAVAEPWYEEAVVAPIIECAADGERLAIVRVSDGTVIGLVDYRANSPDRGWLSVGFIAVVVGQRGWGYGSEAVRLLEAEAKASRFRADVDAGNGLGLGYRPARPGEVPGGPERGIITMVRAAGDGRG